MCRTTLSRTYSCKVFYCLFLCIFSFNHLPINSDKRSWREASQPRPHELLIAADPPKLQQVSPLHLVNLGREHTCSKLGILYSLVFMMQFFPPLIFIKTNLRGLHRTHGFITEIKLHTEQLCSLILGGLIWIQDIRVNWVKHKCIPPFADFYLQNKTKSATLHWSIW